MQRQTGAGARPVKEGVLSQNDITFQKFTDTARHQSRTKRARGTKVGRGNFNKGAVDGRKCAKAIIKESAKCEFIAF